MSRHTAVARVLRTTFAARHHGPFSCTVSRQIPYYLPTRSYSSIMGSRALLRGTALKTLTLDRIATGLDDGSFTVVELVHSHLDRIAEYNPTLRAVIEVNPAAISIAQGLDDELRRSGRRGSVKIEPAHGPPLLTATGSSMAYRF